MTNSYVIAVDEADDVARVIDEAERTRKRATEIFLETHHHLINPRFYTAEQISTKDTLLLRHQWREYDRKYARSEDWVERLYEEQMGPA